MRILMEHIRMKDSLDSKLHFEYISSVRILNLSRVITDLINPPRRNQKSKNIKQQATRATSKEKTRQTRK